MARVVNEKEYNARRNEILDVAQKLIYSKGYDQMSIQDILDALNMSKGAFYHYFDSKPVLVDGLIERMISESMQLISPIAFDQNLSAIEKMNHIFDTATQWKTARKTLLLALMGGWYADNNLVMREKLTRRSLAELVPVMARIIVQGHEEGVFNTLYPKESADVIVALMNSMGDQLRALILEAVKQPETDNIEPAVLQIENLVNVYSDALERVLGSVPGSVQIVKMEVLREWLVTPEEVR